MTTAARPDKNSAYFLPLVAVLLPGFVPEENKDDKKSLHDLSVLPWSDPDKMHAAYLSYKKSTLSPSEYAFFVKSTKDGDNKDVSFGDRIAALTVAVQEAGLPFCVPFLRSLLAVATSVRRREASAAMTALCQLYEPTSAINANICTFVGSVWRAKEVVYETVVRLLEVHVQDQLVHAREAACRLLYTLLMASCKLGNSRAGSGKSANSSNAKTNGSGANLETKLQSMCIALVVSRMADPERKLASRMPWYLLQVIQSQTNLSKDNNSNPLLLMIVRVAREAVAAALADVLRGRQQGAGDRAGYRTIYYGMTLFVQLEKLLPMVASDLLGTYGLLLEHFILSPIAGTAELKRDRKRKNHQDSHKAAMMHSHEFGRIAKLLLIGLSQVIPVVLAGKELSALREKIVLPLRRFINKKDANSTPFAVLCQSTYLLACLPREENDNLEETIGTKLLSNPLLIHHRSLHAMVSSLVAKVNNEALTKRVFQLYAMGILQSVPKPSSSLKVQLSIPDDSIEDERCLWELPALAQTHYNSSTRAYFASLIKEAPTSSNVPPVDNDTTSFLTAWADLNGIDQYAFLRHYTANSHKNKKRSSMEEDFDRILAEQEADVDDALSIGSDSGSEDASIEEANSDIDEDEESDVTNSGNFEEEENDADSQAEDLELDFDRDVDTNELLVEKEEGTKKSGKKSAVAKAKKRVPSVFAFADEFDY